jgi:hypothetical protein
MGKRVGAGAPLLHRRSADQAELQAEQVLRLLKQYPPKPPPPCAPPQAQASTEPRRVRARQQAHAHSTHPRISFPHASQACVGVRAALHAGVSLRVGAAG